MYVINAKRRVEKNSLSFKTIQWSSIQNIPRKMVHYGSKDAAPQQKRHNGQNHLYQKQAGQVFFLLGPNISCRDVFL